jgi:hypothetical protein
MTHVEIIGYTALIMVVGALNGYIIAKWHNWDVGLGAAIGAVIGFTVTIIKFVSALPSA